MNYANTCFLTTPSYYLMSWTQNQKIMQQAQNFAPKNGY